jgi:hypothetical protein
MIDMNINMSEVLTVMGVTLTVTLAVVFAINPDAIVCTFGLGGVRCTFRKNVRDAEEKRADAGIPAYDPGTEPHDMRGRELVRSALDALRSATQEAVRAAGRRPTSGATIADTAEVLKKGGFVGATQAQFIEWLFTAGDSLLERSARSPFKSDAVHYWRLAQNVVYWLRYTVIPEIERKNREPGDRPPPRRHTQVGGYGVFPTPSADQPAATLVAVSGPLKGRHFPVDRPVYHIGAASENDLVVSADEFVSSRHAYLRHQNDNLFLFDVDSRNGTWLNDRRLSEVAETLSIGDRFRVGESTFTVQAASK